MIAMRCIGCKQLAGSALVLSAFLGFSSLSSAQASRSVVEAVTAPSDQRKLSFSFPGVVKEELVKEGDVVKSGQPLLVQDNEIELAELEHVKREAESDARIKYYDADLTLRKKTYERKSKAGVGVFSQAEIEEAEADMIKAERQIDVAHLDHAGEQTKAKQQALKVDRMTLRSPIDGKVQKIVVKAGEFAELDRERPAVVIIKNDPCWVECTELRSGQVAMLKVGDLMRVRYSEKEPWQNAKIIFIDPVTMGAGQTDNQRVRLELPNPQDRATGLVVQVELPQKLADASAIRASGR
jgi:multidrug resistance efflux pump